MKKIRGLRNNNPFNIKKSNNKWIGKIKGDDKVFETFDCIENGYRAGLVLLCTYYKKYKLNNYGDILQRFAPALENDVISYVEYIWFKTNIEPQTYISLNQLLTIIAPYIAYYECKLPLNVGKLLSSEISPKLLNK